MITGFQKNANIQQVLNNHENPVESRPKHTQILTEKHVIFSPLVILLFLDTTRHSLNSVPTG